MKDIDQKLLPQDPLLNHIIPRPLIENGVCGGQWRGLDKERAKDPKHIKRDCDPKSVDPQHFSLMSSKVSLKFTLLFTFNNVMNHWT